jgi:hypothetical protein
VEGVDLFRGFDDSIADIHRAGRLNGLSADCK